MKKKKTSKSKVPIFKKITDEKFYNVLQSGQSLRMDLKLICNCTKFGLA